MDFKKEKKEDTAKRLGEKRLNLPASREARKRSRSDCDALKLFEVAQTQGPPNVLRETSKQSRSDGDDLRLLRLRSSVGLSNSRLY